MGCVDFVDDLTVEAFAYDDARIHDTFIEELLAETCGENPEDVTGTEVDPFRALLGVLFYFIMVK